MTTPYSTLGIAQGGTMWLSPDALRLVIDAEPGEIGEYMAYTDRPTIDAAWRPVERLGFMPVANAFITADCSRIYFYGLASMFYAYQ